MKLLAKTTQYYAWTFAIVLLIHVIISYFSIAYFVHLRLEKSLKQEKNIIVQRLQQTQQLPNISNYSEHELEIRLLGREQRSADQFQTVSLYSKREEALLDYYELLTYVESGETTYQLHIRRSLGRTNELIFGLVLASILSIIILFLGLLLLNRMISKKVWEPFYRILNHLKEFELRSGEQIQTEPSDIVEFNQLNQELILLTNKLQADYQSEKHFVENASHELQTPLAIIKTQLELILQSERLKEEEVQLVATALNAADRLSRINKSLITLSRIENLQYADTMLVDIQQVVAENLKVYRREARNKGVHIHLMEEVVCEVEMSESLAHMIVRNLIQNAIRHNVEEGEVWIGLTGDSLTIRNTGKPGIINPSKLFDRFYRQSDAEGSIGLGLPIVKQICDLYGFKIDYQIKEAIHSQHIFFNQK